MGGRSAATSIIAKASELDKMPRTDNHFRSGGAVKLTGRIILLGILLLTMLFFAGVVPLARAQASNANVTTERAAAASARSFDVKAAVDAYLARVPADQRARSDAYFEGGYWLQLWDFLSIAAVMWILLRFRWSARMRDFAERVTRFKPLQTALYWVEFVVVISVALFPLTVYEGFFGSTSMASPTSRLGNGCAIRRLGWR